MFPIEFNDLFYYCFYPPIYPVEEALQQLNRLAEQDNCYL